MGLRRVGNWPVAVMEADKMLGGSVRAQHRLPDGAWRGQSRRQAKCAYMHGLVTVLTPAAVRLVGARSLPHQAAPHRPSFAAYKCRCHAVVRPTGALAPTAPPSSPGAGCPKCRCGGFQNVRRHAAPGRRRATPCYQQTHLADDRKRNQGAAVGNNDGPSHPLTRRQSGHRPCNRRDLQATEFKQESHLAHAAKLGGFADLDFTSNGRH